MKNIVNQIQNLKEVQSALKEFMKTKSNVTDPRIFCNSYMQCYMFNHATETDIRYFKNVGKTKTSFVDYTMFEIDNDLYQVSISIEEELVDNEKIKITCKIANIRKI